MLKVVGSKYFLWILVVIIIIVAGASAFLFYRSMTGKDSEINEDEIAASEETLRVLERRATQSYDEIIEETATEEQKRTYVIANISQLLFDKKYDEVLAKLGELEREQYSEEENLSILGIEASAHAGLGNRDNYISVVEKILSIRIVSNNEELKNIWNRNLESAKAGQLPAVGGGDENGS